MKNAIFAVALLIVAFGAGAGTAQAQQASSLSAEQIQTLQNQLEQLNQARAALTALSQQQITAGTAGQNVAGQITALETQLSQAEQSLQNLRSGQTSNTPLQQTGTTLSASAMSNSDKVVLLQGLGSLVNSLQLLLTRLDNNELSTNQIAAISATLAGIGRGVVAVSADISGRNLAAAGTPLAQTPLVGTPIVAGAKTDLVSETANQSAELAAADEEITSAVDAESQAVTEETASNPVSTNVVTSLLVGIALGAGAMWLWVSRNRRTPSTIPKFSES